MGNPVSLFLELCLPLQWRQLVPFTAHGARQIAFSSVKVQRRKSHLPARRLPVKEKERKRERERERECGQFQCPNSTRLVCLCLTHSINTFTGGWHTERKVANTAMAEARLRSVCQLNHPDRLFSAFCSSLLSFFPPLSLSGLNGPNREVQAYRCITQVH